MSNGYWQGWNDGRNSSGGGGGGNGLPEAIIAFMIFGAAIAVFQTAGNVVSGISEIFDVNYRVKDIKSDDHDHNLNAKLLERFAEIDETAIHAPLIEFGFKCVKYECTAKGLKITYENTSSSRLNYTRMYDISSMQYPERNFSIRLDVGFNHSPNFFTLGYNLDEKISFSTTVGFDDFSIKQSEHFGWIKGLPAHEYLAAQRRLKNTAYRLNQTAILSQEFKELEGLVITAAYKAKVIKDAARSVVVRPAMLKGSPIKANGWIYPLSAILD